MTTLSHVRERIAGWEKNKQESATGASARFDEDALFETDTDTCFLHHDATHTVQGSSKLFKIRKTYNIVPAG